MNTSLSIKQAETIVGKLSETSKMPTLSTSLPATECKTGAKLRKIAGSVCSTCYALKGCYVFPVVREAMQARLSGIHSLQWENAMVTLISKKKRIVQSGLFRWHDSGDLQSMEHLLKIVRIAKRTPSIKHWIPTKEKALIREYARKHGAFPDNMIVRLSGAMIDGAAPNAEHTSTVTTDPAKATCRAFENDGQCGTCRQCWDGTVKNVVYLAH